jgi:hypothetical protein
MATTSPADSRRTQIIGKVIVGTLLGTLLGASAGRCAVVVFGLDYAATAVILVTILVFGGCGAMAGSATGAWGRVLSGVLFGALCGALSGSLIAWAWGRASDFEARLWLTPAGLLIGLLIGGCLGAVAAGVAIRRDQAQHPESKSPR